MKLVLIQGLVLARYVGRIQKEVVMVSDWDGDFDYKAMVEDLRVNGLPDDIQAQQKS